MTTTVTATSSAENALTAQDGLLVQAASGTVEATSGATTTSEETGPGVAATQMRLTIHTSMDQAVALTNSFYKPKPRYGGRYPTSAPWLQKSCVALVLEVNVRVARARVCSGVFDSLMLTQAHFY